MSGFVQFSSQKSNSDMPGVVLVDPKEVLEKLAHVEVIDVRRPHELAEHGIIQGAKSLVLDTLPQRMDEVPRDKTVVFVCQIGGRSARACAFAATQGYTNVVNMVGGMDAWVQLGYEVVRAEQ